MNDTPITRRRFLTGLLTSLTFTACLNDAAEPTIDLGATEIPDSSLVRSTATPTLVPEPTVSVAPWLPALLEPGPPGLVSPVFFFLNGPDVWLIDGELAARQVTQQRRVRAVATVPGSETAAIVLIGSQGGREAEEIRIIDTDGNESDPVYGPEIVADPAGNPRVAALSWSPDGQRLAILRDDGGVWIGGEQFAEPLESEAPDGDVERVRWSPGGDALLLLLRPAGGPGGLRILPIESEGYIDIQPMLSISDACWLPERGRLVVTEERTDGGNPNAGSLFTIRPDGTERDLLVSAGEFGPAVNIGQLIPSPDGRLLALTIEAPNPSGEFRFRSLYLLELDAGVRRELRVTTGQVVNDLWWFAGMLAWRSTTGGDGQTYDGVEPFLIEVANLESGETLQIFSSDGA